LKKQNLPATRCVIIVVVANKFHMSIPYHFVFNLSN